MPLGVSAVILIAALTVTLIITTNKKRSKRVRIAAGIIGGIVSALSALYLILALIFFGAV